MILVSNNCLAGSVYSKLKLPISCPIVYNSICIEDYLQLIENFNDIDFNNVKFSLTTHPECNNRTIVKAVLEEKIHIYFMHYLFSANSRLKFNNYVVSSNNIIDFVKDAWTRRTERMNKALHDGKKPIFYLYSSCFAKVFQEKYCNLKTVNHIERMKAVSNCILITTWDKKDTNLVKQFGIPERTILTRPFIRKERRYNYACDLLTTKLKSSNGQI